MLRRPCFLLALLLAAASTSAQAQTGPGTIYDLYGSSSPRDMYWVAGDGTGNVKIGPARGGRTTALDTYPGGRQFFGTTAALGPIPGVSANYGDLVLYPEQGAGSRTVTNFRGPQWLDQNGARCRFSNDQRDSFFSFVVYDTRTALWVYYRYNGPVSDVFLPDFKPFESGDPRLDYVISETNEYRFREFYDWDPTGVWMTYADRDASGRFVLSVHNSETNTSTLVNVPSVSGLDMRDPWCSPAEFRLFGPATHADGTRGIVSLYPATGQWSWVIKEGGSGPKKISAFGPTAISPDGTVLAFGMLRVVKGKSVASLVRIPVGGGSYTQLVDFPANTVNTLNAGGPGWRW